MSVELNPDEIFCGRCKEDFPLAPKDKLVQMGYNFPIKMMPKKIQREFRDWLYICCNCYFDLTY